MPGLLIETPRLARFTSLDAAIVVGPVQLEALNLVKAAESKPGRKPVLPKPGKITSTGQLRKHVFDDLVGKQMLTSRFDERHGGIVYLLTALGEAARKRATVSKAPPSGYRKVAAKGNGKRKRAA